MKALILTLTILVSSMAQATTLSIANSNLLFANITELELQHSEFLGTNIGEVFINETAGHISLTLTQDLGCNLNQVCIAVAPLSYTVTLPIVESYEGPCGRTIYKAELDHTAFDGPLETLKVIDNSTLQCRIYEPYMTRVEYKTVAPRSRIETISKFYGGLLKSLDGPTIQPKDLAF